MDLLLEVYKSCNCTCKSGRKNYFSINYQLRLIIILQIMTLMICKGMLEGPLGYGNDYVYEGLGSYLAALIVGVPTSFIFIYAAYRMYQTEGTFSEVF